MAEEGPAGDSAGQVRRVAPGIYVGTLEAADAQLATPGTCVISLLPKTTPQDSWVKSPSHIEVGLGKSKAASRLLRDALPRICEFASRFLCETKPDEEGTVPEKRFVILCGSGKDLSVGVALALYCWCFDAEGNIWSASDLRASFTKTAIRVKLGHIMNTVPDANPSRATLQSVNSYLMDWRK